MGRQPEPRLQCPAPVAHDLLRQEGQVPHQPLQLLQQVPHTAEGTVCAGTAGGRVVGIQRQQQLQGKGRGLHQGQRWPGRRGELWLGGGGSARVAQAAEESEKCLLLRLHKHPTQLSASQDCKILSTSAGD